MKVALLADIHANLPALEAVMNDLPKVDLIVCLGDVVGYYADPNEVCELLQKYKVPTVRGNHDAYVAGTLTPNPARAGAYRTAWTREMLLPANLQWLQSLPVSLEFQWDKLQTQLRHATPWDEEGYLYPDSERLKEINLRSNHFLALGTHPLAHAAPMRRRVRAKSGRRWPTARLQSRSGLCNIGLRFRKG